MAEQDEWGLPLASAPKDDRLVLVLVGETEIYRASRHGHETWACVDRPGVIVMPERWMPLQLRKR